MGFGTSNFSHLKGEHKLVQLICYNESGEKKKASLTLLTPGNYWESPTEDYEDDEGTGTSLQQEAETPGAL